MDDDLDAFFDDVDNAVKEVQETAEDQSAEEVVTAAEETSAAEAELRPAKRTKLSTVSVASSAPVKAVVASSVPVISIAPPLPAGPPPSVAVTSASVAYSSGSNNNAIPIPPPPPPPPPSNSNYHAASSTAQHNTNHPPPPPPPPNNPNNNNAKPNVRSAAGQTWSDPTLAQWPPNDFRLFVGNLAKDLKQHHLEQHFGKYPSFAMARIMYNKIDGKSRGYGFVSVLDPKDCAKAIREMDQSWLGSRPIKVKLSEWKDREWKEVKKRGKVERRKKKRFMGS
eukprot:CAMPEP_0201621864 /NCGR_PEP_ID=MMETSP0492-20130828/47105_1 /ASSEMBLY_ACC=CAM_ASM_000837 /TAXON_ID=420259 /ORGANISM="Thalassiosira gravida, Strain GMp14c1" /LENGTH=280 /DNA_ID=CAMNT_0048091429 /DNA_START=34 /DNA_END=876 /DNA_ORIENTATION=-